MDNRYNEFIPLFLSFDKEFSLKNKLINLFSDCFSFHPWTQNVKSHLYNLDNITIKVSFNLLSFIVISNTSVKNHVTTSILHIHLYDNPVIKTIHQAINIMTTETELFAIRCSINQTISIPNVNYIVVIRLLTCCQENLWFGITFISDPFCHYFLRTQRFL